MKSSNPNTPGNNGLVSYVIPAYNVARYIGALLGGCLAQDYRPIEVVVVNDGSSDETGAVVSRFAETHRNDEFQIVCIHQENQGSPAARNTGLRAARGKFIGHLDADDLIPPDRTSYLVDLLLRYKADGAYGRFERIEDEGEVSRFLDAEGDHPVQASVCHLPTVTFWEPLWCALLMTRDLAQRTGPVPDLRYYHDFPYGARMRARAQKLVASDKLVYFYRRLPSGLTADLSPQTARDLLEAARLARNEMGETNFRELESRRNLATMFSNAGIDNLRFRNYALASQAFNEASEMSFGRQRAVFRFASAGCRSGMGAPFRAAVLYVLGHRDSAAWQGARRLLGRK